MSEVNKIEINAAIYPVVMSINLGKKQEDNSGEEKYEPQLSIDLPRGAYLLYLQKMVNEHNTFETDLLKKYAYGVALSNSDYDSILSLIMKPISRNWNQTVNGTDILAPFGITLKTDADGKNYFSIIEEAEDTIRVEAWEGILLDILQKSAMEVISCFDFEESFQRVSTNSSGKDKLLISLGAWKFSSDKAEQSLSNALREALMFTLVGYYVGDRKNQYSSFEDYFETEFYKRVSFVYGVWSSIVEKDNVEYIPLYDSFYNLSSTSKNELISVLKAILDNDDIALDERQTLKAQLINGAGEFHSNVCAANASLEQNLIKPAINLVLLREKAKETIESAEILCSEGKYVDCANRCYYAMMFTLKMLLEHQGKLANWKAISTQKQYD